MIFCIRIDGYVCYVLVALELGLILQHVNFHFLPLPDLESAFVSFVHPSLPMLGVL